MTWNRVLVILVYCQTYSGFISFSIFLILYVSLYIRSPKSYEKQNHRLTSCCFIGRPSFKHPENFYWKVSSNATNVSQSKHFNICHLGIPRTREAPSFKHYFLCSNCHISLQPIKHSYIANTPISRIGIKMKWICENNENW